MAQGNVLLVSDDREAKHLSEKLMLGCESQVFLKFNSGSALEIFKEDKFDLVIVKFGMPDLDTGDFIQELKRIDPDCISIVLMKNFDPGIIKKLSGLGVYDFVSEPINFEKLFFLIQKGVELHTLMVSNRRLTEGVKEQNASLQKQNTVLARRIEDSTKNLSRLYEDLRTTYMRTIKVLAQAIDARDHYTHSHSENVAKYAVVIANEMGFSVKDQELIRDACELHDIGKIGVRDEVLSKPDSLNEEEWAYIKHHPVTGAQILEPLPFLNGVIELVRQHHEHYDGTGYPDGLKGEEILLGARIIHLADAYESMRSSRAYRKIPFTKEAAIIEIKKNIGSQFDPKVVEAFLRVVDKL